MGLGGGSSSHTSSTSPLASSTTGTGTQATSGNSLQTMQQIFSTLSSLSNWYRQQGKSATLSPYAAPLAASGQSLINTGMPLVQQSAAQILEALRTGGVNMQIPWISRMLDTVRQAGSTGVQQTRQNLARSGFGSTLGGQADVSQAQQQAAQNVANVPTQAAQSLISQAPGYGAQVVSGGQGALGSAMTGDITTKTTGAGTGAQAGSTAGSSTESLSQIFNSLVQSLMNQEQRGVSSTSSTTQNQPSFWDLFNQSLASAGLFGSGFGDILNP